MKLAFSFCYALSRSWYKNSGASRICTRPRCVFQNYKLKAVVLAMITQLQ